MGIGIKIWSLVGIIIAIIGLNLSNKAFQTFHQNPEMAGIYTAIFIFGMVIAWTTVMTPVLPQPYVQPKLTPQKIPVKQKEAMKKSGYATATLTLGILSFVPIIGFFTGVLAYVCGYISFKHIKEKGLAGKGMTIAGILLAMIGMIINISFVVYLGM